MDAPEEAGDAPARRADGLVRVSVPGLPDGLLEARDGYRSRPENLLLPSLLEGSCAHVLDLGAGSGVLGLLAAYASPTRPNVTLVERHPDMLDVARANAAHYAHDLKVRVIPGDLRDPLPVDAADRIVLNPPFFAPDEGRPSSNDATRHATHALHGGLGDFLAAASRALAPRGEILVLYPADRLADVLALTPAHALVATDLLLVHARHTGAPYRAWVRLVRDGDPSAHALRTRVATALTRR